MKHEKSRPAKAAVSESVATTIVPVDERKPTVLLALELAAAGWYVFPLGQHKTPRIPSIHPKNHPCRGECGQDGHGWRDATTDAERIATWWGEYPDAMVGKATGLSGVAVVDVDVKDGKPGAAQWAELTDGLDVTGYPLDFTMSGGWHVAMRDERGDFHESNGGIASAIDLKAATGYVVAYEQRRGVVRVADLPEPGELGRRIRERVGTPSARKSDGARYAGSQQDWLASLTPGKPSKRVRKARDRVTATGMTRDDMLKATGKLAQLGSQGAPGVAAALAAARETYVAGWPAKHAQSWDDALATAIAYWGKPPTTFALPTAPAGFGATVLDDIRDYLGRFVSYPGEEEQTAHALWVAHTHLATLFENTPRIAFLSPEPGSGKSRALEAAQLLVARAVLSANATPAYIFRKIDEDAEKPPTLLLDEVDTIFASRGKDASNEELRGLLNAGYRKGATVGRVVSHGREFTSQEFPSFCPVALAGLGDLPDTLMTRSIVVRMRKRKAGEEVEPYRPRLVADEAAGLRKRLAAWAASVESVFAGGEYPEMPAGVDDRDADLWEPLIWIAEVAGGRWPAMARAAAVALVGKAQDRPASLGVRFLSDVRRVLGDSKAISAMNLLGGLLALEDAPWSTLNREPIDSRFVGKMLDRYGITASHTIRLDRHEKPLKGFYRRDFADAFERYLPELPDSGFAIPSEASK